MRSFTEKDFAAIHAMGKDYKLRIHHAAAAACRRLKLKPTSKGHGLKFTADELRVEHTTSLRDIEAFMSSVVPVTKVDAGGRRASRRINEDLAKQFDAACEKICKLFVLTNVK